MQANPVEWGQKQKYKIPAPENRNRDFVSLGLTGPQAGSLTKRAGLHRRQGLVRTRPSVVPGEKLFAYFFSEKVG